MAVRKYKVGDILKNKDNASVYVYTIPERCKTYRVAATRVGYFEDIEVEPIEVCPGWGKLLGRSWWVTSAKFAKCSKKDRGEISE